MQLLNSDIQTKEVLGWQGIHLIHFRHSACSQKTRIFLNLKGIPWQSHHLDLAKQQNYEDWFLGINPRGLVPVLVHDGVVHIESNDIIQYLESKFADPPLIPKALATHIAAGLVEENDLHLDLRAITMGFLSPKALVTKKPALMSNYQNNKGTLRGEVDPHKQREIRFWQDFAASGITEEQACVAASRFAAVYRRVDELLAEQRNLAGDDLTLLDIAWFIYTHRLAAAGYPFESMHPRVWEWFDRLSRKPEFSQEVAQPMPMTMALKAMRGIQTLQGKTLADVMRRGGVMTTQ